MPGPNETPTTSTTPAAAPAQTDVKMLKMTINGKEVEVKEGTSIIEAYSQHGMSIAHYCWHPGLSVAGVCRLCMVEIEGNPRLQIACNTQVTDGMKVNNASEKVKDAVKWGLDFHLINHPLDCPICDQAGECGLQDQYMAYGKYTPEMAEKKVKKHKVVDLGPRVVLDSERCILCSRCVRFTDEVSKTNELGIFNRGDRAEIGTFPGKPLDNNYSANTIDICPVGALTSKDFRFRQRVWFLKEHNTICTGCSTGCNTRAFYNKEGVFRLKPNYNKDINGYWMCDVGRDVYKFTNKEVRLLDARITSNGRGEWIAPSLAAKKVGEQLKGAGKSAALVLTGQYTNEEYEAMLSYFKAEVGSDRVFHWINNPESIDAFDGLLFRGDRNPNTRGLLAALSKDGHSGRWNELIEGLSTGAIKTVVVAGPENQAAFPDLKAKIMELSKAAKLIWLQAGKNDQLEALTGDVTLIPLKTYLEKTGTYVNYAGIAQTVHKGLTIVPNSLSLTEVVTLMKGEQVAEDQSYDQVGIGRVHNEYTLVRGTL
jgi:NADH-quinone oxidoreductase subunit G